MESGGETTCNSTNNVIVHMVSTIVHQIREVIDIVGKVRTKLIRKTETLNKLTLLRFQASSYLLILFPSILI